MNPFVKNFYDIFMYLPAYKIRKKVVKICLQNKRKNILDLSCGTGYQIKMLNAVGLNAIGIDIDPKMLLKANQEKEICFQGDSGETALSSESYDAVMSTFAIHEKNNEKQKQVIKEMLRLVKQDGDIIIVDFDFNKYSSFYAKLMITGIERLAGKEHYRNFKSFIKKQGLKGILKGIPLQLTEEYYFAMNCIVLRVYNKK